MLKIVNILQVKGIVFMFVKVSILMFSMTIV